MNNNANKVKIGMAQLLVEGGEPERNLERAVKLIEEGSQNKCNILLLPETIDFAWTHPSAKKECCPIPGKFSDFFCKQAKKNRIYICMGLTEKIDQDRRYNTAIIINNKGEIILRYHKINLLEVELPYYEVGQTLNVVDTPFGKIGVNICSDNYIDSLHIGHALARMGAQIILSPSSWTVDYLITEEDDPYKDKWEKPLKILSQLYGLAFISTTSVGYIVGGPYEGKKMVGCSLAVNKGNIVAEGLFNEFAGKLTIAEFEVPDRKERGTQIGEMLTKKGHRFDQQ